jgi:hypothetical protein
MIIIIMIIYRWGSNLTLPMTASHLLMLSSSLLRRA